MTMHTSRDLEPMGCVDKKPIMDDDRFDAGKNKTRENECRKRVKTRLQMLKE